MRGERSLASIRASSIFQCGDKVELSLIGLQSGIWEKAEQPISGEVIGFCRERYLQHAVRIRLKGRKSCQVFAWWFWERAGKGDGKT